eukprot:gnl/MRDRNA2_/MRDRNA2_64909_c0_seq2.p1 gnl/MRDRNA2_/MRDRNA2_64909_c0~~gnl/MRDRNA2_/MRDRNA2_64909_c0_seq2.p1  ORF type:complete len:112 (-),score=19.53 gnl/MRDRNA2_/MRDRNA2_64909_c0_seq2:16-351(-)
MEKIGFSMYFFCTKIIEHLVPERPGLVCRQRAEARFKWLHGVEPVTRGERFSLTWRWFAPGYAPKAKFKGSGRAGRQDKWMGRSSGKSGGYSNAYSSGYSMSSGGQKNYTG